MGQFVNPDNYAFQSDVNSQIYVDKTGLIEYTNRACDTAQKFICNSRPRRFGKSYTADMLTAYYSRGCDSGELFSGFEISKTPGFEIYLNQSPVIHLDIQWFYSATGNLYHFVENLSAAVISELSEVYPDLDLSGMRSLPMTLSRINAATGDRFVVIIDEWDALIRDEAGDKELQEKYINFLRGLFKGAEPTRYIRLAYLTGILPIKRQKTQSALNNFDEFTMTSPGPLSPYIGFTEEETKALCKKYDMDFRSVKFWYDGYLLRNCHVYNPNAVVKSMQRHEFGSYWTSTASYGSIVPFINMNFDGLKTTLIDLIAGGRTEISTITFQNDVDQASFRNRDDVLTLLIHLGYLAYDQKRSEAFVPNEEIRLELTAAIKDNKWTEFDSYQMASEAMLDAVLRQDSDAVSEAMERIHNQYASQIKYNDENSLSSVLTIAFMSSLRYYFKPVRELPSGRGFADLVYLPRPEYRDSYPALVVELKWNSKAETALQQIHNRHYTETLTQYTGELLLVGINYDRKTKEHSCVIEEMTK